MTRQEAIKLAHAAIKLKTPPLIVRFWSKVDIRADNECWPWKASFRRKVRQLRDLYAKVGLKKAAEQMGINYFTAWDMCHRSWRHVCHS